MYASLVLLTYNRPHFVRRTLASLHSTAAGLPFELIVVDDGSDDATRAVLLDYAARGSISTLVLNLGDNMGVGVGINRGFSIAHGEYLVKLDSDLEFSEGWLAAGATILDYDPRVGAVGFFHYWHPPVHAHEMLISRVPEAPIPYEIHADFVSSAMMIRRSDYLKYGLFAEFSPGFSEDVAYKKLLQANGLSMALTARDYIHNYGFGIPHSTVVLSDGSVAMIHTSPKVFQAS